MSKLRKNSNFQTVYKTGKSFANKWMVLHVAPNQTADRRVGFAAGKKLGNAVVRNRVKRLLREVYRLNQHELINGLDMILVGRHSMAKANYGQVEKALLELCDRARIRRENDK